MNATDLKPLLEAQPFKPFALGTTRVGTHTVASPTHAFLTYDVLYLGVDIDPDGIPHEVVRLALRQITSCRTLEP
jgi:hypothetical protein